MLHARNRLGLTVAAAVLTLSGCGGDDATPSSSSASAASPASTQATAATTSTAGDPASTAGTSTHIPATPGGVPPAGASGQAPGGGALPACPLLLASEAAAVIGGPAMVLPSLDPATSVICSWVPRSGATPSLDVITVATAGTPDYFSFNDLRATKGLFGERGFVDSDRAVFQQHGVYVDITFQAKIGGRKPGVALMTKAAQQAVSRLPG